MLSRCHVLRSAIPVITDYRGILTNIRESNVNVNDVSWSGSSIRPYTPVKDASKNIRNVLTHLNKYSEFHNVLALWKSLPEEVVCNQENVNYLFFLNPLVTGNFRRVVSTVMEQDSQLVIDALPHCFARILNLIITRPPARLQSFVFTFEDMLQTMHSFPEDVKSKMTLPVRFYLLLFRYLAFKQDPFLLIDVAEALIFSESDSVAEYFTDSYPIIDKQDMELKRMLIGGFFKALRDLGEDTLAAAELSKILKHDDTRPDNNVIRGKSWLDKHHCQFLSKMLSPQKVLETDISLEHWYKIFRGPDSESLLRKWLRTSKSAHPVSQVVELGNATQNVRIITVAAEALLEQKKSVELLDVITNFQNNSSGIKMTSKLLEILCNSIKFLPVSEVQSGIKKLHQIEPSIRNRTEYAISRAYISALCTVVTACLMEEGSDLERVAKSCVQSGGRYPNQAICGLSLSVLHSDTMHTSSAPLKLVQHGGIDTPRNDVLAIKSLPHMRDVPVVTTASRMFFDSANTTPNLTGLIMNAGREVLPSFPQFSSSSKVFLLDIRSAGIVLATMRKANGDMKLREGIFMMIPFSTILSLWDEEYIRHMKDDSNQQKKGYEPYPKLKLLSEFIKLNNNSIGILSPVTEMLFTLSGRNRLANGEVRNQYDTWEEVVPVKKSFSSRGHLEPTTKLAGFLGSTDYRDKLVYTPTHPNFRVPGKLSCQQLVFGAADVSLLLSLVSSPLMQKKTVCHMKSIVNNNLIQKKYQNTSAIWTIRDVDALMDEIFVEITYLDNDRR
eukprot:TRINITY_DN19397_c0_g1_i1.p1 TRINITY_DN19397_c0_g1~~TRINITY_DN19397_c0_g1_i1.p1  ORF type:complete len:783 (+),score=79.98 TRINITY_DN19397_c0_g1_i1:46-2394(+)